MKVSNATDIDASMLDGLVREYDTGNLRTYIRHTRKDAETPYSGVCYYKKGRIRVSVNPKNLYPVPVRIGSPFDSGSWNHYMMKSPEDLMCFVFLHELSHYLDYRNAIPVRCKQTKADLFALRKMGLIE